MTLYRASRGAEKRATNFSNNQRRRRVKSRKNIE